jgi:hypothetical protein
VHGVYKPGNVKLRPSILKELQDAVGAEVGRTSPFDLVFHGGSGSTLEEIHEALDHGVVKMNVDTDTQYAFTRPVADHMFTNYDGVLKVDGEVGNKKVYDPRSLGQGRRGRHGRPGRRGLREDALRRAGWRGQGPIPWAHEPNRGFLRALAALARAAQRIGEEEEWRRCADFLHASSADAARELGV